MRDILEHEVIIHGVEHAQYFQGCGTSFSPYEDVATGIGSDAYEAFEDALEQLAQSDWDIDGSGYDDWTDKPEASDAVLPEDAHEELHVYVSIRVL